MGQGCSGAGGMGVGESPSPVGGDHSDSPGWWVGRGSPSPCPSSVEGEGVLPPQAAMTRMAIRRAVRASRSLVFDIVRDRYCGACALDGRLRSLAGPRDDT